VLVILNAFYNDLLIPENLVHSSGKVWLKILIAVTEGVILISAAYACNRASLNDNDDGVTRTITANRTGVAQLIITACFIVLVILN
jgi:hypothetical protein